MLNENIPMYLFHQGTNAKAYEYLGSHRDEEDENFTFSAYGLRTPLPFSSPAIKTNGRERALSSSA